MRLVRYKIKEIEVPYVFEASPFPRPFISMGKLTCLSESVCRWRKVLPKYWEQPDLDMVFFRNSPEIKKIRTGVKVVILGKESNA